MGSEDALSWNEEGEEVSSVVWRHDSIPFLQFGRIDLFLSNGQTLTLLAQLDHGTGYHGLYIQIAESTDYAYASPISRWRELNELPVGLLRIHDVRRDGPHAVIELQLRIGSDMVRLVAAEVWEDMDGTLRIVEADESILVQLNGLRP
jgi:hypothetical protein